MFVKRYASILLLSLIMVLAAGFSAFADEAGDEAEAEAEGSSVIVSDEIMKIWEQTESDEDSGPDFINAVIGKAAADPDAEGIASAVVGRWETREVDLPGDDDAGEEDPYTAYYLALAAMINNAKTDTSASGPGVAATAADEPVPVTDAEGRELIPLGRFAVTKYCPCSICCGKSGGMTASGKRARSNHTIAADTRLYPFGTQLMVNGIIYTVEDMGGSVKGNTVDIFVDSHAEAVAYGTQYADVYLVK